MAPMGVKLNRNPRIPPPDGATARATVSERDRICAWKTSKALLEAFHMRQRSAYIIF